MLIYQVSLLCLAGIFGVLSEAQEAATPTFLALEDKRGVRVWDDKGSTGRYRLIVWESNQPSNGWYLLGQRAQANYKDLTDTIHAFKVITNESRSNEYLAQPTRFTFLWDSRGGSSYDGGSVFRPECPKGYVSLGDFFYREDRLSEPPKEFYSKVRCVKETLTELCGGWKPKIWDNARSFDDRDASVWEAEANTDTSFNTGYLYANNRHNIRPDILPRCLRKSYVKVQT